MMDTNIYSTSYRRRNSIDHCCYIEEEEEKQKKWVHKILKKADLNLPYYPDFSPQVYHMYIVDTVASQGSRPKLLKSAIHHSNSCVN